MQSFRGPMSKQGGAFEPKRGTDKPREKRSRILLRLWRCLMGQRVPLILAVVMTLLSNLLALAGPYLSGLAVDKIAAGAGKVDIAGVLRVAGVMLAFYLAASLMSYALSALMVRVSSGVTAKLRRDVFRRLMALPVRFFDRHPAGDVLSVVSYDIDTLGASLSTDLVQMLTSLVTVVGSLAMMLAISPALVLVFAATIPLSVLFTRFMTRRVRPLYRERSRSLGEMNGFVEEMAGGMRTVRAYSREEAVSEAFDARNKRAVDAYYNADYMASMTGPSVNAINNLSLALVSVFGALSYMAGGMTLGAISSFVLYSRKFSGPINEFANILSELQSALAAAERVFRLLDEPAEADDAPDAAVLSDVRGEVRAQDVSFGYDAGQVILSNLSLDVKPGSVVAIVGPTGAGKTTLINLLMRFYDVDAGAIRVDGADVRSLTRASLRGAYTMVLQDTWLFHGTVLENLAYGAEGGVSREEVEAAARAAKIHRFITSLPQGYDTLLTGDAGGVSKGQRQLLTIARAMLHPARMLILDEATSNVDTHTEHRIRDAMLTLQKGRTCFVIAHRLSTIQSADVILVMRDGNVVEQGTHAELMARRGFYYDMYRAQFEG